MPPDHPRGSRLRRSYLITPLNKYSCQYEHPSKNLSYAPALALVRTCLERHVLHARRKRHAPCLLALEQRPLLKKAILEAEAATIKSLHQIEEEKLKLRQRKTQLKLETEMAKAEAEELAYAQAEEREISENNLPPRDEPPATIYPDQAPLNEVKKESKLDGATLSDIKSEDFPGKSTPVNPKVPLITKSEEPASQLNPDAPEWRKESSQEPTPDQQLNSSPQATPVSPPKGDIQLLLHKQQEAIMALTLPQPEVPVFTCDPIEYCEFVRAFENLVERKTSSPSTRLYYLLQYTSGPVQDLVRSRLTIPDDIGYNEARKLLAERYG